ncbi:hypothetical protein [Serratia rhizosphaerae]
MMMNIFSRAALLMLAGSVWLGQAQATCYRITATNTNASSNYYTDPSKGIGAAWSGSTDTSGSIGTLPTTVNINNSLFQPDGTPIASGTVRSDPVPLYRR